MSPSPPFWSWDTTFLPTLRWQARDGPKPPRPLKNPPRPSKKPTQRVKEGARGDGEAEDRLSSRGGGKKEGIKGVGAMMVRAIQDFKSSKDMEDIKIAFAQEAFLEGFQVCLGWVIENFPDIVWTSS
ncbi:hypothetical protein COCNU_scaffold011817G000010 [Cocos nucifera]|nr:hypothetical protein [Cocos nucifera]